MWVWPSVHPSVTPSHFWRYQYASKHCVASIGSYFPPSSQFSLSCNRRDGCVEGDGCGGGKGKVGSAENFFTAKKWNVLPHRDTTNSFKNEWICKKHHHCHHNNHYRARCRERKTQTRISYLDWMRQNHEATDKSSSLRNALEGMSAYDNNT